MYKTDDAIVIRATHDFIGKAKKAVWDGYDIVVKIDRDIASWMYDAASLLDIVMNDEQICGMIHEYYAHPERLPWNKRTAQ
jgi:hypothetical protein